MFNRKGQNILEYSILIALVVGAAVAMQTYVKRGLQGRVKNAVDYTGSAHTIDGASLSFDGNQYEPYYASSNAQITSNSTKAQAWQNNGQVGQTAISDVTQKLTGSQDMTASTAGQD